MNLQSIIKQYAPDAYLNMLQNFDRKSLWYFNVLEDLRDRGNNLIKIEEVFDQLNGVNVESLDIFEDNEAYTNPQVRIIFKLFGHAGYPGGECAIDFGKISLEMDLYAFMMLIMFESNRK